MAEALQAPPGAAFATLASTDSTSVGVREQQILGLAVRVDQLVQPIAAAPERVAEAVLAELANLCASERGVQRAVEHESACDVVEDNGAALDNVGIAASKALLKRLRQARELKQLLLDTVGHVDQQSVTMLQQRGLGLQESVDDSGEGGRVEHGLPCGLGGLVADLIEARDRQPRRVVYEARGRQKRAQRVQQPASQRHVLPVVPDRAIQQLVQALESQHAGIGAVLLQQLNSRIQLHGAGEGG